MEVTLGCGRLRKVGLAVCLLMALALLGRFVTPVAGYRPQVLTPQRWQALLLRRQAEAEVRQLAADLEALHALAGSEVPDAIQALSLAQRLYVRYRRGTVVTAAARQAMLAAAEATAHYAAGALDRAALVEAVNRVFLELGCVEGRKQANTLPFPNQKGSETEGHASWDPGVVFPLLLCPPAFQPSAQGRTHGMEHYPGAFLPFVCVGHDGTYRPASGGQRCVSAPGAADCGGGASLTAPP